MGFNHSKNTVMFGRYCTKNHYYGIILLCNFQYSSLIFPQFPDNFFINMMLIPILGAQGAVIGTIAAESVVGIIQWIAVFKGIDLKLRDVLHDNIKPFLGAAIMLILLVLVRPMFQATVPYTILYGVLGGGIYSGFMLLLKDSMVDIGIGYLRNTIYKGRK